MKQSFLIILALIINALTVTHAQNLVINSGFESYSSLPQNTSEWHKCDDWNNVSLNITAVYTNATPDYFNAQQAYLWAAHLPRSHRGYINAHTGDGIMGFITYNSVSVTGPAFREYLSSQLTSAMVIGDTYTVSFWLSNAEDSLQRRYGSQTDGIGVHFSTAPLTQAANQVINVTPQLVIPGQVWNTEWTQYTFSYTPTTAWQFITIGSFDDDASQARSVVDAGANSPNTAYYFIDDIIIETVSPSTNGIDTITDCDSHTWIDGVNYTASNNVATHTIVGGSVNGVDSIVTLDLTIHYTVNSIDSYVECGSLTWIDGNNYTANNTTATHAIVGGSFNGCDSIVTLDLTISSSVNSIDTYVECGSLTWIDGNNYTTNNTTATHTIVGGSFNGCDSIVTLDLTISSSVNSIDTYVECGSLTWIDGNNYTASNTTATYTIVGGSFNNCDSIVTLDLTISSNIEINLGGNTSTCNEPIVLTPGNGFSSYLWNDGSTFSSLTVNNEGIYSVTVTDIYGCSGSDLIEVSNECLFSIWIPNVFTPNDDYNNDTFYIKGESIIDFELLIFNRWGELLFETNNILNGWDGTFKGRMVPSGTYVYIIKYSYNDKLNLINETKKGHLTLLR